jgi:hypothetical protein
VLPQVNHPRDGTDGGRPPYPGTEGRHWGASSAGAPPAWVRASRGPALRSDIAGLRPPSSRSSARWNGPAAVDSQEHCLTCRGEWGNMAARFRRVRFRRMKDAGRVIAEEAVPWL